MKFKINSSPHLTMSEITKKLFNHNFLSDIQFCVGGKIIYAHSLELMKRSEVFEKQLEDTLGNKKKIPITYCSYDSFLQFVRFIYTDECDINNGNGIELLKLATQYKIIILENLVINSLIENVRWTRQIFEHCVINKYEIARNRSHELFAYSYGRQLKATKYLSLHQVAVNEALQFDKIETGVAEVEIFNALAGWIDNYCKQNEMSLIQGRERFDGLIRKIRFPTMTYDEIRKCVKKYPGLLNDNDCTSIARQLVLGSDGVNNLWLTQRRSEFKPPYEYRLFSRVTPFVTTFSVSNDTILHAVWIGVEERKKDIEIEITAKDVKTLESKTIVFIQSVPPQWNTMLISLGDSLELKPNIEYTIAVKYMGIFFKFINVNCRIANTNLILSDPVNSIQTIQASNNMLEMHFKSPPV